MESPVEILRIDSANSSATLSCVIISHCWADSLSGIEFGYLLGGAVIVEQIFALPGLGRLVLDAIQQRDYALVQGSVLFIARVMDPSAAG